MDTKTTTAKCLSSIARKEHSRCSICGATMRVPQKILCVDDKRFCDKCYRDNFYAESVGHRPPLEG